MNEIKKYKKLKDKRVVVETKVQRMVGDNESFVLRTWFGRLCELTEFGVKLTECIDHMEGAKSQKEFITIMWSEIINIKKE